MDEGVGLYISIPVCLTTNCILCANSLARLSYIQVRCSSTIPRLPLELPRLPVACCWYPRISHHLLAPAFASTCLVCVCLCETPASICTAMVGVVVLCPPVCFIHQLVLVCFVHQLVLVCCALFASVCLIQQSRFVWHMLCQRS